jgi:hypothetical protein
LFQDWVGGVKTSLFMVVVVVVVVIEARSKGRRPVG